MPSNDIDQSDIFVNALKLGFLAISLAGLTMSQAYANSLVSNNPQNIVPHQASLWSYLA